MLEIPSRFQQERKASRNMLAIRVFFHRRTEFACTEILAKIVDFSIAHEKSFNWIWMLWWDVNFHKCRILQCIFHLNYILNSNLLWTCKEFCCIIHQTSHNHHNMEYFVELFFIHSDFSLKQLLTNDFSLNRNSFFYIYMYVNSVLIMKNSMVADIE